MIFVDRIAFGGVLSLSKKIGKIRHSTVTLLLTTITAVLMDAHIYIYICNICLWSVTKTMYYMIATCMVYNMQNVYNLQTVAYNLCSATCIV